jgi:hypothetical protein
MKKHILHLLLLANISTAFAQGNQNALNFDGSNDYVQTGYTGISGNNSRTVEAWIKTTVNSDPSTGAAQHVIVDWGTTATGGRFTLNILWGNTLRIEVGGSGINGKTVLNDGNWHHVAASYDPSATYKFCLYVDGVLDTSANNTTTVNTTSGNTLIIGKRVDNVNYFEGEIDEVRVWNHARTASQIADLFDKELCPNHSGLVAYFRLNQGTANANNSGKTTAVNSISSAANGSLINFGLSGSSSNWVSGSGINLAPDTTVIKDTTVCGGFVSPQGRTTIFTGSVTDIYTSYNGCDSLLKYNVTVKQNSFIYQNIRACDSFRTSKGLLKTANEIFTEKYTNQAGCDSTVQTNLVITQTKRISADESACIQYISPTGKTYTASGSYTDTLISAANCDSIITTNLVIYPITNSVLFDSACSQYTSPKGFIYTMSGTYNDTLSNENGCDSTITIYLTILKPDTVTFKETACDSFISFTGANTWLKSGFFKEKLTNQVMCDSIVQYDLTINYSNQSFVKYDECNAFTTSSGTYIQASGIYTEVLTNSMGCDSTITLNSTITKNEPIVSKNGDNMEVDLTNLSYQWLDCNNAYASIPSATFTTYKPSKSGNYAVEVTENDCKDTSACLNYPSTARLQDLHLTEATIVPNPAQYAINIHNQQEPFEYEIMNQLGQLMLQGKGLSGNKINISELVNGTYYVKVKSASNTEYVKLIVQKP